MTAAVLRRDHSAPPDDQAEKQPAETTTIAGTNKIPQSCSRQRLKGKQPDPAKAHFITWQCKLCKHSIQAPTRQEVSWRKCRHFKQAHPKYKPTTSDRLRIWALPPDIGEQQPQPAVEREVKTLNAATLQEHNRQKHAPTSTKARPVFGCPKKRKRDHQKASTNEWGTWWCPHCQQDIKVRGESKGLYWRKKHLQTVHGSQLKDCPSNGKTNNTVRAFMRAKQMLTMTSGENQHNLVHVKNCKLQDCVPPQTTWICSKCLSKGSTGHMGSTQCQPQANNAGRARWIAGLRPKQCKKLQRTLNIDAEQWQEIDKHAAALLAKSKSHTKRHPSDAAYNNLLKQKRAAWRRKNNLCAEAAKASGATNSSTTYIPKVTRNLGMKPAPTTKTGPQQTWRRDLTEEGVEPNPGPRSMHTSTTNSNSCLKAWQINIASFQQHQDIMQEALKHNVSVMFLQETRLSELDIQSLNRSNKHWQFFQAATSRTNNNEAPTGGTAVVIRKGIPAVLSQQYAGPEGEWTDVAIKSMHLVSTYRRPGVNPTAWSETLAKHLATLGSSPWIAAGDWNEEPLTDAMVPFAISLHAVISYPFDNHSEDAELLAHPQPLPTRWNGNRCIDWSIQHNISADPHLRLDKYSDHRLLEYNINYNWRTEQQRCFTPTPTWKKPEHLASDEWQQLIDTCWTQLDHTIAQPNQPLNVATTWQKLQQALCTTFTIATAKAYAGRTDGPKQSKQRVKHNDPTTYIRHYHHRATAHHSTSIYLARLRRLHKRHVEFQQLHRHPRQRGNNDRLCHNISRTLQQLHCPHNLQQGNGHNIQTWIDTEIAREEETQRQARLTAWRQRLRDSTHNTWQWLGRGKKTPALDYLRDHEGHPVSGDDLIHELESYWQNIWPNATQANLDTQAYIASQHPWPHQPTPDIQPLTSKDIRAKARKLIGKAPGPDGWIAAEVAYAPEEALATMSAVFQAIENGQQWPTNMCQWKQLHITKPGKPPGQIASTRPLSLGSIWYRIWSSLRIAQLADWTKTCLPPAQHGCVRQRGTHTALIPTLAHIEASMVDDTLPKYRYAGTADLSKAFDRLDRRYATAALSRMGMPRGVLLAISNAWQQQQRWITSATQVSQHPCTAHCLPQGDPASPIGLIATLSEPYRKIIADHPEDKFGPHLHNIYMDDRSWFTTNTTACVSIAQHWQAATPRLQLGENPSKADFTAFGPNANQQALQNALTNANCPGTVKPRIKILGSITQPQRRPCGPAAEDTARLTQANRVIKWARMLPHPCINKAAFAKATGLAIAAAPSFTRLPAQRELDPLRKSMAHAHGNPVIQCGPLFRLIAGHTADPYYRVGHTATMHTLTTAFNDAHLRRLWPTAPTQGPINTAKHWLKRQGWNNTGPWRWNHNQANYIINAAAVEADPGNHTVIDLTNFTKAALDHALREGWRAHTWMDFKATGNRAALTLQHYQWTDVADRAKKAALAYQKARPEHRQHILAIITNRYVSQARYDHNRSQAVRPCHFCNAASPDRLHEWWGCAGLHTSDLQPRDDVETTLGWPLDDDHNKLRTLASARIRVLEHRYK